MTFHSSDFEILPLALFPNQLNQGDTVGSSFFNTHFIGIQSSHLRLDLSRSPFPLDFLTKNICISHYRVLFSVPQAASLCGQI